MNNQLLIVFTSILAKLAAIVAMLGTIVGSGTGAYPGHISQHFGASLPPNVAATTTLPAQTSYLPFFSSYDGNTYTISSSSMSQVGSALSTTSSTLQIGSSTNIGGIGCVNISTSTGAVSSNASTSFSFPFAGVTTSSKQAYFWGVQTSTAAWSQVIGSLLPASTTGLLNFNILMPSGTSLGAGVPTFNFCYVQT